MGAAGNACSIMLTMLEPDPLAKLLGSGLPPGRPEAPEDEPPGEEEEEEEET